MVVKSATKKKLMDLGCPEYMAHRWADDRIWDDIIPMNFDDIMNTFPYNWPAVNRAAPFWGGMVVVEDKNEYSKYIYDIVETMRENELDRLAKNLERSENTLIQVVDYPEDRDEPFVADYPPSWCLNCEALEPLVDGFCQTCEYFVDQVEWNKIYIQMIENFGMIPIGSPYSYLREDIQNFMNWLNENPFEVKS